MNDARFPASVRDLVTGPVPLWPLTSMRIGGSARWYAKPHTQQELETVTDWAQTYGIQHMILGGGTNLLFSDAGYPGLVIQTNYLDEVRIEGRTVTVQCGAQLAELSRRLSSIGLSGLEWASGIPGTIGGAVVMNAGAESDNIASMLSHIRIITSQGMCQVSAEQLRFGYRTSSLLTGNLEGIVLDTTLLVREDSIQHCLSHVREVLKARRRTQPAGASSGCIFKNPQPGPTAGELLDRAACKGMRVGQVVVSTKHANFIINEGENNAGDVFELIRQMKQRVLEAHEIELQLEVIQK